ncbi:MAG: MauE/DoxX family redox-associated membrane protein, partial [Acidobacteriota bacterium]
RSAALHWSYLLVRIGLGLVFVYAGGVKLMNPRAFARTISGYGLVPDELLVVVAIGLPVLECLAGAGLLFDVRHSLKAVTGLLVMFLAVLGYAILGDMDVDCGCFSTEALDARHSLRVAFLRDLGLMAGVVYLFIGRFLRGRAENRRDPRPHYGFHPNS